MKKFVPLIIMLFSAVVVSAQPRLRVAVLPTVAEADAMDPQGQIRLADKVRELASKNLPINQFILLKQDAIVNMIGEEELFRSCKEGVCIGDLTKRVNADYGMRCEVFEMNGSPALKFELYSVDEEAIIETFTNYDVNDFRQMLALLDTLLPSAFNKMLDAYKSREIAEAKAKLEKQQEMERIKELQEQEIAKKQRELEIAKEQQKLEIEKQQALGRARKPKTGMSAGAGGFWAGNLGGGIVWDNGERVAMPYYGGGAYLFFDAKYAEAFAGYSTGGAKWKSADISSPDKLPDMRRTYANAGLFAKYPTGWERVKLFPLLGIEYEYSNSGELKYDYRNDYVFDGKGKRPAAKALSALWFRAGGGIDFGLGESVYIRAEFLYGLRTANTFEKDFSDYYYVDDVSGGAGLGHGLVLKSGVGVKF